MAEPCSGQAPKVVVLTIDIGTTTAKGFLSENPDSPDSADYPLEFRLSGDDRKKTTTELDTTLAFTENGQHCVFGSDGLSYSGAHVFRDWKLGAMGLEPYAQVLAEACERLRESAPQLGAVNPATLYRKLFSHIQDTAKRYLHQKYGSSFDAIKCYLTYPVSCSESLRLLLRQEASAVGLDVMGGVSEPLAAAYYIKSRGNLNLPPGAKLIIDFGGATVDAVVVYEDSRGQIKQACASNGFPGGGQTVNQIARDWLKKECPSWNALNCDIQWALNISSLFDRCKRAFTGQSNHDIYDGNSNIVTIPLDAMKSFFEPLISGGVKLAKDLCDRAMSAGHPVNAVVVCGGVADNRWFFQEFSQRLIRETCIELCKRVPEPEIVAHGALCYARSPIVEECVITRHLGLTYDGDYTRNGAPLTPGTWHKGIGWILREGQDPKELPSRLEFSKDIKPHSKDKGDHKIETDVYATPAHLKAFGKHIRKNRLIKWDCAITYPATGPILSRLSHLGTISGILPHEEMFPLGTETKESEFEFQLTLEVSKQLLKAYFSVKLRDGRFCQLRDVRYTPLPLVPRSEFLNCSGQGSTKPRGEKEQRSNPEQQSPFASVGSLSASGNRDPSTTRAHNRPAIVVPQSPGLPQTATPRQHPDRRLVASVLYSRRGGLKNLRGIQGLKPSQGIRRKMATFLKHRRTVGTSSAA